MPETLQQYSRRLESYVDGRDPIVIQRQTPATLARLIGGVPPQHLTSRLTAEKWAVVEILAHMAEDEIATGWRYRQMIEHHGGYLSGFDQDLWARLGKYSTWSAGEALDLFRLLREANLRMLGSLAREQWECSGEHAERGKVTVASLARHMAAHDLNHIQQVEMLLEKQRELDASAQT